jgi:hypothetical protein
MFSLIINQTPQTGRPKFARQLIMANTLIYSSTLYYNKNLDLTTHVYTPATRNSGLVRRHGFPETTAGGGFLRNFG